MKSVLFLIFFKKDTVIDFTKRNGYANIKKFMVAGASKVCIHFFSGVMTRKEFLEIKLCVYAFFEERLGYLDYNRCR